jgi:Rrf2 family protein
LGELRRSGLLRSQRGPEGGYRLSRPATEISIADVIRALDGELANVRGSRPENLAYIGSAAALQEVWIALRASERTILEGVTLAHVVSGELPKPVAALAANPAAWS